MTYRQIVESPHFWPALLALLLNLTPVAYQAGVWKSQADACPPGQVQAVIGDGSRKCRSKHDLWYVDPAVLLPQPQGTWSCRNPNGCEVELIDL